MKRGIKNSRLGIRRTLILCLIFQGVILHGLFSPPARAENASVNFEKRAETLQKEAYYHFFLGDYLTSATRLKLVEQIPGASENNLDNARLLLGGLYIAWGMYRPATVLFDRWVGQFPPGSSRDQLLLLIERLQYRRALYQSAIDTFGVLSPEGTFGTMDQARYLAGMSHYLRGSFQEGIRILEAIPPSSGYFPFARLAVAQSYVGLGNFEKSTLLLKNLGEINPHGDPVLRAFTEKSRLILGFLLVELRRYQEAQTVFASVPASSPFYPDALFGKGSADFDAGRYTEALPPFQELFQTFPDHAYALEGLIPIGGSFQKLGAWAKSLQSYGEALVVYDRKEKEIGELRGFIQDRDRLVEWLDGSGDVQGDRLLPLIDDDPAQFQIDRYRELSSLLTYLDQKLADMGVYKIMVDHREEVFQRHLPTLKRFLDEDPIKGLQEKERLLRARLEEAIQKEEVTALATHREKEEFDQLARAQSEERNLKAAIERSRAVSSPDLLELKGELEAANRRLSLVQGELLWRVITEAPGRIDDLRRSEGKLEEGLESLSERRARLMASIPSMERDIDRFRQRIQMAHQALLDKKATAVDLQKKLVPPLQALLLQALDKKRGRIEQLAAVAKLNQIQILDLKSRP
jgi:tetratricopeptide (TPR) repeat protein